MHVTPQWQDASGGFYRLIDLSLRDHPLHTGGYRGVEARIKRAVSQPDDDEQGEQIILKSTVQRIITAEGERLWIKSATTQVEVDLLVGDPQDVTLGDLPPGGDPGQHLAKHSAADFDTEWVTADQNSLPPGGATGQLLAKQSGTSFDTTWLTPSYAASSHTHPIAEVVSLQTTLDGKAATVHTHAVGDVTGLQTALDAKQPLDDDLTAFAAKTAPAGAVVGTTDSQVLTNKTINAFSNTISNLTTALFAPDVVDTDPTLAANSTSRLPAQSAVKSYVDNFAAGLHYTTAVRVATTANGTLATAFANGQTVDGVVLATGNRILIKNQTTGAENGIYTVTAGAPTRGTDADTGAEVKGIACLVTAGTANINSQWQCSNGTVPVLGTDALTFVQIASGSTAYTAGTGLSLTGNQFAISDPELLAILGLSSTVDRLPYFTGVGTAALATFTAFGRTLVDDLNSAAARTTLGLATAAQYDVGTSGGTLPQLNVANTWSAIQNYTVSPTVPTPTAGDSSTKVATTAFVGGITGRLPTGGAANQVLCKNSATDYDVVWKDRPLSTIWDYGGSVAGNNDSAIASAMASGKEIYVPDGVYTANTMAIASVSGVFHGPGQLKMQGHKRGKTFISATARPTSFGDHHGAFTAFDGDLSRNYEAVELRLSGTALGTPTTGFLWTEELIPFYVWIKNDSGWNEATTTADGRTTIAAFRVRGDNSGLGGIIGYSTSVFATGVKPGATSFLANTAAAGFSGEAFAGANGVYLNPLEVNCVDQGWDAAGIAGVFNLLRNNDTQAGYDQTWIGVRIQSVGTKAANSAIVASGKYDTGLDMTRANLASDGYCAIALADTQKIFFEASNLLSYWHKTENGDTWMGHQSTSGLQIWVEGSEFLRFQGGHTWVMTGNLRMQTGNVSLLSATARVTIGGVGALAAPDTGWVAMTGAADKTAVLDTATVTLEFLARRVKVIQDMLMAKKMLAA